MHSQAKVAAKGSTGSCVACEASDWQSLPVIRRPAMRSDGAMLDADLAKIECASCGLVMHAAPRPLQSLAREFGAGYALYAHPPGASYEGLRQATYADWIVGQLDGWRPASVFEIGCGNGSLLMALGERLPGARLCGMDPSPDAVGFARAAQVDASVGYLDSAYRGGERFDLVVSVNVIEHTSDPREFIAAASRLLAPDGRILFVCPDGNRPSSELLVYDHLFTFTRNALSALFSSAALTTLDQQLAPSSLGDFQSILATVGVSVRALDVPVANPALHSQRTAYLQSWASLDHALSDRCRQDSALLCFGVGEAVRMLLTYAPLVTQKISAFVVDEAACETFAGRPVLRYESLPRHTQRTLLLGVRTAVQPVLAERFQADGFATVRWDDLIAETPQHAWLQRLDHAPLSLSKDAS
ncbi:class I SAM-dependent methyltransferase [Cognatiluteimonas profundi]|uniref:class I SAM-dependent methyltransferase n=1 Tax=Cognatiluteimonas profundi TaxID=2594501 RepID=UPI00131C1286|nr:class I SAM-dependent methyltransferase [Lysobacter profundi]